MSSEDSQTACKSGTYAFYKEEKFYDYDNPGFSLAVGHFTQVNIMILMLYTRRFHLRQSVNAVLAVFYRWYSLIF